MVKIKGFTLIELLIVVVVVGILVSLAIPNYMTSIERTKAGRAKFNLQAIRSSESWYRAHEDIYTDDLGLLEANWGLPLAQILNDTAWTYTVDQAEPIDLNIVAERNDGPYSGETISMDEDGKLTISDNTIECWGVKP
ncbi:MAG: prepilin-type N-terminal cleavage/methylation domain-containing protein [Candidatus Omnitrophica bacterium]|nr:prepilin-type N-terminal cleavage/methylation domain-containing protein [Candidatus Omnitrophota bacterium]